ncbi:hypothetical protein ANCCAN_12361 [Ancylostoma caninum]|uniref:Uncharacterized protein n=1 Tax=Ancylostoma caninum TaxID=29170 RepID=A0A368GBE1_ANCCA|nr:hypothetical protein ANCCAN_12361 [Ancylostoma caninum]
MDYEANGLARIQSTVRLALTLHETACVRLEVPNSSYSALHVITFSKLEQHHPVSEKYIFAIPLLSTSCFCDCAGGTKACSIEGYKHRKCRQGVLCYNTYHSAQSSEDCGSKQKSEACCWIRLDIYENRTYEALLLGQADTFAEFKYSLYEWTGDNWKNSHREDFAMLLNRGHAHARSTKPHRLEMFITSRRAFRDVKPGMYYVDEGGSDVCGYVPMNKADEASLEKLGWLQYHGSWDIRRGSVKMQQAHNVHFKSCKAQTYINDFDAEYLVLHMDNNSVFRQYHMGKPLSSDPWVHSARYGDRTVIVQLEDAGHVELTIFAETIPKVIRHSSRFEYFEGSTQMDERSNRFLNISFFEARGTILGNVYLNNTRTGTPEKIRVYVGSGSTANFTTLISISSSVNGSAYVCFHPDGDLHGEQCRWLPFRVKNYEEFHPNAGLHGKKGMSFPGLNQEEDDMWTKIGSFAESLLEQLDAPTWRRRMKLIIAIALLVVVVTVACCASKVLHWAKKCCLCILPVARTR